MKNVELLAPAGSLEKLKYALLYGADAVYFGGKEFSLRANAKNFSRDEMIEAVKLVHSYNKKCYVTCNIVFHNEDLTDLEDYLLFLDCINVDAILASDTTVMMLYKKLDLKMELHISTQASILNHEAAKFYKSLGATRLVLAREASKEDIKKIKDETGLEIECFMHGAMCTSISGRCVMSNYATNRDSNRGGCVQICRWVFDYYNNNQKLRDDYVMTPKDLNMISNIQNMINIGVNSFKIEGRMRSIYYVSTVISTYRTLLDKLLNNEVTLYDQEYALKTLNRVANRESREQFFNGLPTEKDQYFNGRTEQSNQDFLALVLESNNNILKIEERNTFDINDEVEFLTPSGKIIKSKILSIKNTDNENITSARHPMEILYIEVDKNIEPNSFMRVPLK